AADNIISTMNDSLILLDKDRNIITVNKATQGLLGYKKKELEAKPLDICLREEKSKSTLIDKITKGETISEYDIAFQTKKGKYIPVSFSSSTLRDEAGGISGVVCIARNMTERKQAEENLKIAYAKLKQTQEQLIQAEKFKAIGELASGIAHEVRNPLAIISQGVNYLENKVPVKENISEILDMLKSNVKRANDIIRSLVDFSRVTELNLQTEDINAILESAVTLVEHMVKLESIKFVKQLNTDLPLVSVDKGKMEQVFLNLFLNAIQAMPKGGTLFIRSYATQLAKSSEETETRTKDSFKPREKAVVVEIEDTGIGISQEDTERIFDPFYTTKGPRGGTGLGLTVTGNIIKMHKALMEIESKLGKGTKFIITLPP
ncbi:MAG: PAS domain S-box protein, partial [Candidatus Omnitrophica bacterium]|nr:PAS domain S-box protein [Candidatus Omnitrophota bacterium]